MVKTKKSWEKENCLVCGMEIKVKGVSSKYEGKEYHFCSSKCKTEFDRNPYLFTNMTSSR